MFVYLKCLFQPKQDQVHRIEVVSRAGDELAFRSETALPQGTSRVSASKGNKGLSFEVEVYHHDERYDLYEGRILRGTQSVLVDKENTASEGLSFIADLEEVFRLGALVRTDHRLIPGSYLKVEYEGGSQDGQVNLAEVLWVTENVDSSYNIRLRYHEESRLKVLPELPYLAKVG